MTLVKGDKTIKLLIKTQETLFSNLLNSLVIISTHISQIISKLYLKDGENVLICYP